MGTTTTETVTQTLEAGTYIIRILGYQNSGGQKADYSLTVAST